MTRNPLDDYCKKEWDLLCWIHREIGQVKGRDKKGVMFNLLLKIWDTLNDAYDVNDWPESQK